MDEKKSPRTGAPLPGNGPSRQANNTPDTTDASIAPADGSPPGALHKAPCAQAPHPGAPGQGAAPAPDQQAAPAAAPARRAVFRPVNRALQNQAARHTSADGTPAAFPASDAVGTGLRRLPRTPGHAAEPRRLARSLTQRIPPAKRRLEVADLLAAVEAEAGNAVAPPAAAPTALPGGTAAGNPPAAPGPFVAGGSLPIPGKATEAAPHVLPPRNTGEVFRKMVAEKQGLPGAENTGAITGPVPGVQGPAPGAGLGQDAAKQGAGQDGLSPQNAQSPSLPAKGATARLGTGSFAVGSFADALKARKAQKDQKDQKAQTARRTAAFAVQRTGTLPAQGGAAAATMRLPVQQLAPFVAQPRPRFSLAQVVGNALYTLGFAAEYQFIQIGRVVRDGAAFFGQLLAWLFGVVFAWLGTFFAGLWRDVSAPFRRFLKQQRQLKRLRQRAATRNPASNHFGLRRIGVKSSLQFLLHLGAFLLPVVAAAALFFTVNTIVSMRYALAVEVNGRVLGYVTDQSVVENAKVLLRERLRLAEGQEMSDWQLNPHYALAWTDEYTTAGQLANLILLNSDKPGDLVQATGLYIAGELYTVTLEGHRLQEYLDSLQREYRAQAQVPQNAQVSFVRGVVCDVDSEDVFFASAVESFDEVVRRLDRNVEAEVTIVAGGEDSMADIALANELPPSVLVQRNPALAAAAEAAGMAPSDYVPPAGASVLVRPAVPLLQMQYTQRMESIEQIPYPTVEEDDPERPKGARRVVQQGVPGQQQVVDEFVFIDGQVVRRVRDEAATMVLAEPVPEVVQVGSRDYSNIPVDGAGFVWPAPTSRWSSRGMSAWHYGWDINAPTGEPLLACEAGVVTYAGWHFSWGYNIVIDHQNGFVTRYAHCSYLAVQSGQQVARGEYIGDIGSTGNSSGPHLHLEMYFEGVRVNPADYLVPPDGFSQGRPR